MKHLNTENLPDKDKAALFSYNRKAVGSGIVHFGVGNFHRCHQAVYCDKLLGLGHSAWGITGISMRSANVKEALEPQNYLYTQITLGSTRDFRIVGALTNIIVAPQQPEAAISATASAETQLVTCTITEKGYYLKNGTIDLDAEPIAADLASLDKPNTLYGFIAAALIRRYRENGGKLTVLCCDNIKSGGETLKNGCNRMLQQHDSRAADWAGQHVSFISSMVDRVSPATTEETRQLVQDTLQLHDNWPVAAEPFSQWVIEDHFAGARPPFEQVGALLVDSIDNYENMKLRLLNASHSIIATLGYLYGDNAIHQALARPDVRKFVEQALQHNILPVAPAVDGIGLNDYAAEVLQRFENQALPYAVLQVGSDSSQKIQQRWFPTIDAALAAGLANQQMAFMLAAWVHYIDRALSQVELNDPLGEQFSAQRSCSSTIAPYLELCDAKRFNFYRNPQFMAQVGNYYRAIADNSIDKAVSLFFNTAE